MNLITEMHLEETCYDGCFINNEKMFALAQNKYTYIYDDKGIEIHCLKGHERPYALNYLPYHYLLSTIGHSGWLKWQDISTGQKVAGYQTGHGPSRVLKHNPVNAVSHVGHSNGVVSLWSPAAGKALVSLFTHKGPVTDLAIDREGKYMATSALDGMVKLWDLRTFKTIYSYHTDSPVVSLDISDTGLLAWGMNRSVQVLKDAFQKPSSSSSPSEKLYMKHEISATGTSKAKSGGGSSLTSQTRGLASSIKIKNIQFRPYEDILAIGHSHGLSNIIVPGSGEANFDSLEANPFQNNKQAREAEVQSLLNKLSYEMIGLDSSFIGSVDKNQEELRNEHKVIFNLANEDSTIGKKKKEKNKARGRNKISAKLKRKQKNVIDSLTVKLKSQQDNDRVDREAKLEIHKGGDGSVARGTSKNDITRNKVGNITALSRFAMKPKSTEKGDMPRPKSTDSASNNKKRK